MTDNLHVTALHTYPIKSCAGLSHGEIAFDERGPVWDRRWMLVEPDGMFVTQRELPRLALIQPAITGDQMRLTAPGMGEICLPLQRPPSPTRTVQVWEAICEAWDEGGDAAEWFSDFLKVELRLVRIADDFQRVIDTEHSRLSARSVVHTGFADGYPVLIVSEESLAELNRRLVERGASAVPMNRFRPNIVVAGGAAFAEDRWQEVQIGSMVLDVVKPCARCAIPTVDQQTGVTPDVKEPTATLNTFRKQEGKVLFAQNAIHREAGIVRVGDVLVVL
jgi:uncharacterized protein